MLYSLGFSAESMTALTGGLQENIKINEKRPEELLKIMKQSSETALICCNTLGASTDIEDQGLVTNHVYSMTLVIPDFEEAPLIQLRNPWGETEWTGQWSDTSEEFDTVPEEYRIEKDDGEFFMSLKDFSQVRY